MPAHNLLTHSPAAVVLAQIYLSVRKMRFLLLVLAVTVPTTLAQVSIGCFEPGECTGSLYIDVADQPDPQVRTVLLSTLTS